MTNASAVSRFLGRHNIYTAQTGFDTYGAFCHGKGRVLISIVYPKVEQVKAVSANLTKLLTEGGYQVETLSPTSDHLIVWRD